MQSNLPLIDLLDAALGFHETLTAVEYCTYDSEPILDLKRAYKTPEGLFHNVEEADQWERMSQYELPDYMQLPDMTGLTIRPTNMLEDQA